MHLSSLTREDVYKRQIHSPILNLSLFLALRQATPSNSTIILWVWRTVTPVSYTHLDVYKRQVFGVRGANGVILVTTRRGEVGKPAITLTTSVGLQQISKFLEPANSYEYATADVYKRQKVRFRTCRFKC